jgi:hypothetical protein
MQSNTILPIHRLLQSIILMMTLVRMHAVYSKQLLLRTIRPGISVSACVIAARPASTAAVLLTASEETGSTATGAAAVVLVPLLLVALASVSACLPFITGMSAACSKTHSITSLIECKRQQFVYALLPLHRLPLLLQPHNTMN